MKRRVLSQTGIIWLACLSCLLWMRCGYAAELELYGLTFEASDWKVVDERSVQVQLRGEWQMLPLEEAKRAVARRELRAFDEHSRVPLESLQHFIEQAHAQGQQDLASEALASVFRMPSYTLTETAKFAQAVESLPGSIQLLKNGIEKVLAGPDPQYHTLFFELVTAVGVIDPRWVRAQVRLFIADNAESFLTFLEKEYADALRRGDTLTCGQLTNLIGAVFGKGHAQYQRFVEYSEHMEVIREAERTGELQKLTRLLNLTQRDTVGRSMFDPVVIAVFHREANQLLKNGDAWRALQVLSNLDRDRHTPTTHKLVSQSFQRISVETDLLEDPAIVALLESVASRNDDFKSMYVRYLDERVRFLTREVRFANAERMLLRLVHFRPDPNVENDRLRMLIAFRYLDRGSREAAEDMIQQVQSGVTLAEHFELAFRGFYISRLSLILFLGVPALGLIVLYVLRRMRLVQELEGPAREYAGASTGNPGGFGARSPYDGTPFEEGEVPRGFSYSTVRKGLSPRMYEYVGLLRTFDLDPEADFVTIRSAYRTAVKAVHPDLNPNASEGDRQRFLEYTSAYERIIELRKRLGFPSD